MINTTKTVELLENNISAISPSIRDICHFVDTGNIFKFQIFDTKSSPHAERADWPPQCGGGRLFAASDGSPFWVDFYNEFS